MLKMTVHVKEKGILPKNMIEYRGNKEVGEVLKLLSESLLNYPNDLPKDIPLVATWCGQIMEKIEIVEE